jgi:hypothetical protein
LPLNEQECRDGIIIRTPNGCRSEERDYPNLESYSDYKDCEEIRSRGSMRLILSKYFLCLRKTFYPGITEKMCQEERASLMGKISHSQNLE